MNHLIDSLPMLTAFKWDRSAHDLVQYETKPRAFLRDNKLFISAENGDGAANCDTLTVNPRLVEWAKKQGGYFEWYDNGTIVLAE